MGGLVVTNGKNDEEAHLFKLTVLRYCLLSYCLLMRKISKGMRKEYWSSATIVEKGLITQKEVEHLDSNNDIEMMSLKWFVPLAWANDRIKQSKFGSQILIPVEHKQLLVNLKTFQNHLQRVHCYCEYPIPTVYKQVKLLNFLENLIRNWLPGCTFCSWVLLFFSSDSRTRTYLWPWGKWRISKFWLSNLFTLEIHIYRWLALCCRNNQKPLWWRWGRHQCYQMPWSQHLGGFCCSSTARQCASRQSVEFWCVIGIACPLCRQ